MFSRFERADDRMMGGVKVFRGVFVLGIITAADVAALHAHPQVDPRVAHREALLTTAGVRLQMTVDALKVSACRIFRFGHDRFSRG
jgi:hypothetical protein